MSTEKKLEQATKIKALHQIEIEIGKSKAKDTISLPDKNASLSDVNVEILKPQDSEHQSIKSVISEVNILSDPFHAFDLSSENASNEKHIQSGSVSIHKRNHGS